MTTLTPYLSVYPATRFPASFALRVGRRKVSVCRDFRSRYYRVNPVMDVAVGMQAGHLEILLLRKWLVVFSKAW
jgi:hypothetical protein